MTGRAIAAAATVAAVIIHALTLLPWLWALSFAVALVAPLWAIRPTTPTPDRCTTTPAAAGPAHDSAPTPPTCPHHRAPGARTTTGPGWCSLCHRAAPARGPAPAGGPR